MATGTGRRRRGSPHAQGDEAKASPPTEAQSDAVQAEDGGSGQPGADGPETPSGGDRRRNGWIRSRPRLAALAAAGLAAAGLVVVGLAVVLPQQPASGDVATLWGRLSAAMTAGTAPTVPAEPPPAEKAPSDAAPPGPVADVQAAEASKPPEPPVPQAPPAMASTPVEALPVPPSVVPAAAPMPTPPPALPAERGRQQPPLHLAAASPIPQRKPKAALSRQTGAPTVAAPAGAAVVLTVGQSTVGSTLRVLGPGSSDRLWPDRTREIAYRFGRHRVLVEGMAVTGVTLWFDPKGVLAAARVLDPASHPVGNPGSVAVLPATMAGY